MHTNVPWEGDFQMCLVMLKEADDLIQDFKRSRAEFLLTTPDGTFMESSAKLPVAVRVLLYNLREALLAAKDGL